MGMPKCKATELVALLQPGKINSHEDLDQVYSLIENAELIPHGLEFEDGSRIRIEVTKW